MTQQGREIRLVRRPEGMPKPDDFAVAAVEVGQPGEGEIELQTLLLSVDPYMRPRLDRDQPLEMAMLGGGIARVMRSRHPDFAEGALVRHMSGMRDRFVSDGRGVSLLAVDPDLPLSVYMHALGGTGLTAYGGLLEVGALRAGEQVFVSTAAGSVGSVAAQIAKLKGCYVIGSTGSAAKAAWLRDVAGLDAVIDYRAEPLAPALKAAAPKGIDIYFENVGGSHLDAALPLMNVRGRIPVCGMISTYNGEREGVRNLSAMIYSRVRMEGFVASDFGPLRERFAAEMTAWLKDGRIRYQETVLDGFEATPAALIGLFEGRNAGKMLVRVAD